MNLKEMYEVHCVSLSGLKHDREWMIKETHPDRCKEQGIFYFKHAEFIDHEKI